MPRKSKEHVLNNICKFIVFADKEYIFTHFWDNLCIESGTRIWIHDLSVMSLLPYRLDPRKKRHACYLDSTKKARWHNNHRQDNSEIQVVISWVFQFGCLKTICDETEDGSCQQENKEPQDYWSNFFCETRIKHIKSYSELGSQQSILVPR